MATSSYYIIAVPTPTIGETPDLSALKSASEIVGRCLKPLDLVVLESTVFPGTSDEVMIPILEKESGLKSGLDFFVGYCPERIVPGTEEDQKAQALKIISGQNKKALKRVQALYEAAMPHKTYCAQSMKVAEAAKLIENIQRDVNVALLNEYTEIMEKMNISIHHVLDAAKTKWNFLPFQPGLVGGHCIPIDPYYLIYQAKKCGANAPLITLSREINEHFVDFISSITQSQLKKQGFELPQTKVVLLGLSFKPNVSDTRHSLSVSLNDALRSQGTEVLTYDPIADHDHAHINRVDWESLPICHAMILTQPHEIFIQQGAKSLCERLTQNGVFMDIPGVFANKQGLRDDIAYWGL